MSSFWSRKNCRVINVLKVRRALSSLISPKLNFDVEWSSPKSYASIPGMTKLQLVRAFSPGGKLFQAGLNQVHKTLRAEFGDIYKFPAMFGRREIVTVFNAKDIENVFRSEGKYPHRDGLETLHYYRKNIRPDVYGEFGSLASEQNQDWHKMRTIVNPVMMKPGIVRRYIPQVDEISKDFMNLILKLRDSNNEVPADFSNFLNMWSLEAITNISINRRLGLLCDSGEDEKAEELIKLVRRYFNLSFEFEVRPPIWKIHATRSFKELMSILDGITNIIIDYVDKAMEDLESLQSEDREESILEKLAKINKKVAVVMCTDALFAGVDTTSSATIGILYCLAKNQEKQNKLREELRRCLPDPSEVLTVEKMTNLPYLRAVMKESIRLFSPVSGTVRRVTDDVVLCGHQVPKGTDVLMIPMLSYRSEEHFDQAEKFIPERWLKKQETSCPMSKKAHPFAFLPFGFGARMCIGRRIAEMEIEVLITRLIRDYKVEWNYSDMKVKSVLINIPDGDLKFQITKAD